jgi:hypothetical protein
MEEKEISSELAKISQRFDNATMRYRINGFAEACGLDDLEIEPNKGESFKDGVYKIYTDEKVEQNPWNMTSELLCKLYGRSEYVIFDTAFARPNRLGLVDEVQNSPRFFISVDKIVDDGVYGLVIKPADVLGTYNFTFNKKDIYNKIIDSFSIQTVVMDFEMVLRLIKSHVKNPQYVYEAYQELTKLPNYNVIDHSDTETDNKNEVRWYGNIFRNK